MKRKHKLMVGIAIFFVVVVVGLSAWFFTSFESSIDELHKREPAAFLPVMLYTVKIQLALGMFDEAWNELGELEDISRDMKSYGNRIGEFGENRFCMTVDALGYI